LTSSDEAGTIFESLGEVHRRRRAPVPVDTGKRRRWPLLLALLLLAGGAAALAVTGLPRLSFLHSGSGPPPVLSSLRQTGSERDGVFLSGSRVTLSWTSKPRADRYRLQVSLARGLTGRSDAATFGKRPLTLLIRGASYRLRPNAAGVYYWRVAGERSGDWGRYASSRPFTVMLPPLAPPALLWPRDRVRLSASARLCWSSVKGATGYWLWISGRPAQKAHGTCTGMRLRPGRYSWAVAAIGPGSRRSPASGPPTGRYSGVRHFTVLVPPQPAAAPPRFAPAAPTPAPMATPAPVARPVPQPVTIRRPLVYRAPSRQPVVRRASVQPPAPRPVTVRRIAPRIVPTPVPAPRRVVVPPPTSLTPRRGARPAPPPQPTPVPTTPGCIPLYTC
jgi:hypothetical protein